jgi:tetratricopeptide (TPR) repeat protein
MDPLQERAQQLEDSGDLPAALQLWKSLAEENGKVPHYIGYGRVAEELKRWDEAEEAFTQALRKAPSAFILYATMGALWRRRTDRAEKECLEEAKHWYLEALKLKRNVIALTLLGATYVSLEDIPSAREAFEEAIELDPNYEEALYNLAALEEEGNLQRSRDLLERAIQIDPDYSIAHQMLGRVCQHMKDRTRAEFHFRRCLEIDPTDYWANLLLANLLGVLNRNDEAEQTYRRAISLRSDLVGGSEFFARFLESIGKHEEANSERAKANLSDRYAAGI